MRLSFKELFTLLPDGHNDFSFLVNRGVIEETIKYRPFYETSVDRQGILGGGAPPILSGGWELCSVIFYLFLICLSIGARVRN